MLARVSTRCYQGVGDIVVSSCRRTVLCRKRLIALSSNKLWIMHPGSRSSFLRWPYVIIAAPFRQRSWQACNHQGAWPGCDRSSRSSELLHAGAALTLVLALGMHVDSRRHEWHGSHRSRALSARASGDPETSSQLSRRTTLAASAATAVTLLPGRLPSPQQLASHSTISYANSDPQGGLQRAALHLAA